MPQNKKNILHILKDNNNKDININNFTSYNKTINNIPQTKRKKQLPTLTIEDWLIDNFNTEAKRKKWSKTTLMNEILKERYGRENIQNEDD
ncbi:hypothetical protein [Spiroplasma endosymbiont of Megaselia nigra]|uniref:hypothetical protein n=1 Tax=Spiroplasma endosymbiont of Megaselia nigra TaxID=2478537 RepID=UPI000F864ABC|nr:hypothetical protein [Spiroplasma endosymbiont of Megaselia nigra]RUO85878.1 hypothetical protein D9R21_06270 [Spiroplasma endosymbiont of Megaselia nigra]